MNTKLAELAYAVAMAVAIAAAALGSPSANADSVSFLERGAATKRYVATTTDDKTEVACVTAMLLRDQEKDARQTMKNEPQFRAPLAKYLRETAGLPERMQRDCELLKLADRIKSQNE